MFNQVKPNAIEEHWNGQWFLMNARVHPYRLPFHRQQIDGAEDIGSLHRDKVSLLLPRDSGTQAYVAPVSLLFLLLTDA